MNKKLAIGAIVFAGFILLCFVLREMLWVIRDKVDLDDALSVQVIYDQEMLGWIDPVTDKKISVINQKTGSTLDLNLRSLEWDLYFFVDKSSTEQVLRIVDKYLGSNEYDYATLKFLNNNKDCFDPENSCGGLSDQQLADIGKPTLAYDIDGFKK